jgi:hypothetical protein
MVSPDYRIVLGLFLQPLQGSCFTFSYRHLYRRTSEVTVSESATGEEYNAPHGSAIHQFLYGECSDNMEKIVRNRWLFRTY